jgi:hypothetical protein
MVVSTLLNADKTTIALEALKDGKIRVNSSAWSDYLIVLPDQILEARWGDGQVTLIRRARPSKGGS